MKVWNWLNGKKTALGMLFVIVSEALVVLGYSEYATPIRQLGELLGGVGLIHKAVK